MKKRTGNWLFGLLMILIVGVSMMATSCTENTRAKYYGGNMTIKLEQGEQLVNVTWKDADMWILTKEFPPGATPAVYKFKEKSTYGLMEGEITIVEWGAMKTIFEIELTNKPTAIDMDNQPKPFMMEIPVAEVYLGKH